jgi:hypothetical protein
MTTTGDFVGQPGAAEDTGMRRATRAYASRLWLLALACLAGLLPIAVFASPAGAGLPDGRVYEQVSPVQKNGEEAGANIVGASNEVEYTVASADGDQVLYGGTGPFGEATSGADFFSVSRRAEGSGWGTAAALPEAIGRFAGNYMAERPISIYPAADMSASVFTAGASFAPADPIGPAGINSEGVFLARLDRSVAWLSEPTTADPLPVPGEVHDANGMIPAGGSPDLGTVYFGYYGTLVPGDASRKQYVVEPGRPEGVGPWGFYESKDGLLSSAGVLPDGSLDPFGAVPAGGAARFPGAVTPDDFDNEVSEDGSRAFFVSPDPQSDPPAPESDPPELYVRLGGHSILVSRDALAGDIPAPGPAGISIVAASPPDSCAAQGGCAAYAYASPDGSHVFFASLDKLARSAAGEEPTGAGPWTYEFDVDTESLTYLPGVGGSQILASSRDGSRFLFLRYTAGAPELVLSSDRHLATIAALPSPPETFLPGGRPDNGGRLYVAPARATADGTVFVFETDSPLPGALDAAGEGPARNGGGYEQVYRYDVSTGELSCLSCTPLAEPSGDARLSNDDNQIGDPKDDSVTTHLVGSRGLSADGGRVFFDTPAALVPQDINGVRDVYGWEDGKVQLISGGTSPQPSFFLDNSASGDDVFFATAEGISPDDADGSYDVYDARVGGGFPQPHLPVECTTNCQGEPTPAPAFGPSPAESASGAGNVKTKPKAKHHKHRHHHKKHRRFNGTGPHKHHDDAKQKAGR